MQYLLNMMEPGEGDKAPAIFGIGRYELFVKCVEMQPTDRAKEAKEGKYEGV
jgi:hypothetical protein